MWIQSVMFFLIAQNFPKSQTILLFHSLEGVVLIDPDYMKDKKVYGHVQAQLTHGSDDPRMFGKFNLFQMRN